MTVTNRDRAMLGMPLIYTGLIVATGNVYLGLAVLTTGIVVRIAEIKETNRREKESHQTPEGRKNSLPGSERRG